MDFSAGSSSSSTSRVFYSQPFTSQSKVNESSLRGSRHNTPVTTKTFKIFTDNEDKEVISLLSSDSEEETDLVSTSQLVVFNKAKGKEREHSTERDFSTITSAVGLNTIQLKSEPVGIGKQLVVCDKGKSKELEHSQIDNHNDELVDMEIDSDIPQPTTIISNQLISYTKDTVIEPVINQAPKEIKLENSSFVKKVIEFFNSYNYKFDIFDIVIDLSNKYQEIFQEDSVDLQQYHNNPCVLLELLSFFLSTKLELGKNFQIKIM